ncbi:MAG: hypothetical protein VX473_00445 [Candidatus Thermoplasmatota archaeon]|nr:hypothetical protein [Candidatus Thermoplasmatota archaeon]
MFKQVGEVDPFVSGSWISDRPASEEHPVVPLGINEMTVPRISILASFGTIVMLIISGIWIGFSASTFLEQFEDAFAAVAEEDIQVDGRWTWEATLLFDNCVARDDAWSYPSNLGAQDDIFWYPGELECIWEHQGEGDYAHLAIHNVDNERDLPISIEVNHAAISIDGDGQSKVISIDAGDAIIIPLKLEVLVEESEFTIDIVHVSLPTAKVSLDVEIFSDGSDKDRHARSEHLDVDFHATDADTGDTIGQGTTGAYAGEDPRCDSPVPWICRTEGFGWSLVGLDVDNIDPTFETGTSHILLLPPDFNGDEDGQDRWIRLELTLNRLLPA